MYLHESSHLTPLLCLQTWLNKLICLEHSEPLKPSAAHGRAQRQSVECHQCPPDSCTQLFTACIFTGLIANSLQSDFKTVFVYF